MTIDFENVDHDEQEEYDPDSFCDQASYSIMKFMHKQQGKGAPG